MKLEKPYLAKCNNRNKLARVNRISGSPDEWFSPSILSKRSLYGFTYDFFVNWNNNPPNITPTVWVKRILSGPSSDLLVSEGAKDEIIDLLVQNESRSYLEEFAKCCMNSKLVLQYLIFRDVDWRSHPENIIVVQVSWKLSELDFSINFIDLNDLKNRIRLASGGPVRIGRKGLIYGTSRLECLLSTTDSLYPGDVDQVLTNDTLENIAILEYKKHNLDSSINNQKLGNYYPRPDKRKYDRLAILRDYLPQTPKLFVLYYPTNNIEGSVIEYISGSPGNLVSTKRKLIALPTAGHEESFLSYVCEIMDFIESN